LQELKNIKRVKVKSIAIKKEEHDKAKKILDTRYKVLYKHGSISAAELNIKESEVNNLLAIYQQDLMGLNEIEKQIIDLNSSTNELDFQKANEDVLSESTMIAAFENLKNNIQGWEAAYVLTAPITGKLSFVQFVKDNRYLKMEQEVAQIIPENNANETFDIIGELLIPSLGSGKVAIGQIVNIELKDYPKKQYGIIEGKVESIGAVNIKIPNSQGVYAYQVSVVLPDGLKNSRNKQMKFRHNMQGNAEIITADIRLIERFFHEARELVDAK